MMWTVSGDDLVAVMGETGSAFPSRVECAANDNARGEAGVIRSSVG
jgi:hypothetical protein